MIFLPALVVFCVLVMGFGLAAITVLFHLNRYAVPGDRTATVRLVFLVGSAIFAVLAILTFFAVPWNALSLR